MSSMAVMGLDVRLLAFARGAFDAEMRIELLRPEDTIVPDRATIARAALARAQDDRDHLNAGR
jgi:hypothetical protein